MAGLIIELFLSWLLLWIFSRQHLSVLGFAPTKSRIWDLFSGFLIAAVCATIYYLSFTVFANYSWKPNNNFTNRALLSSSWWTFKSVLYEEFIFRGALLYLFIRKFGIKIACIASAICFGVYHWFTSGAMGNSVQMVFVFVMTAIWGFMFAMAFVKTRSLYLPVALHFGWNFITTVIFSQGPLGKQFLVGEGQQKLGGTLSAVVFLFQLFAVPLITFCYIRLKPKKKNPVSQQPQPSVTPVTLPAK